MKKLYVNEEELNNYNSFARNKIILSETLSGVVQRPELFAQVRAWLAARTEELPMTYPKFLNRTLLTPLEQFLTLTECAGETVPARHALPGLRNKIAALYTLLIIQGCDKEDGNRIFFKAFVESLGEFMHDFYNHCPIVRDRDGELMIRVVHDLAHAENDEVFAHVEHTKNTDLYFPSETVSSYVRIERQAQSLIESFEVSREFMKLYNTCLELHKAGSVNDYRVWTPDDPNPFAPPPQKLAENTGKIKIIQVKLNANRAHTLTDPKAEITEELLATHKIVQYKNLQGRIQYCINNPELIQKLSHERE